MFRVSLLLLFGFLAHPMAMADSLTGPIRAEVLKIVDGDTIRVRAMIWVDQSVEVSVRLRGVDAPELFRPKCPAEKALAYAAKAAVAASAPVGSTVNLTGITRDKYGGRVVASVVTDDGETLAERLLAQGQGIAYGAPKPWCGV